MILNPAVIAAGSILLNFKLKLKNVNFYKEYGLITLLLP